MIIHVYMNIIPGVFWTDWREMLNRKGFLLGVCGDATKRPIGEYIMEDRIVWRNAPVLLRCGKTMRNYMSRHEA